MDVPCGGEFVLCKGVHMVSTLSLVAAGLLLGQTSDAPVVNAPPYAPKVYIFNNGVLTPANDSPRTGLFGRKDTTAPTTEPNRPILSKIQSWFKKGSDPAPVVSTPEPPVIATTPKMPPAQASPAELPKRLPVAPTTTVPKTEVQIIPQKGEVPATPQKSSMAPKTDYITPTSLKQTTLSAKTPILPANVNRIGHEEKFAWITGQLEVEKGKLVLYYATPETVDRYHGHLVLVPQQVDMRSFQSGDLISVHGHLGSRGGSTTYFLGDASLIERAKR